MHRLLTIISVTAFCATAHAQSTTVDYDDGKLVAPPQVSFPFYNASNFTCRWQSFVPAAFAKMPKASMFVSRIGFQLSGTETYKKFELRAGVNTFKSLDKKWSTNLPDQRLQADLSGLRIVGGQPKSGKRQNQWVEFELNHPILWKPGQHLVVDLTTNVSAVGNYLYTATSQSIPRVYDYNYQGGSTAPVSQLSNGVKIRLVFEPISRIVGFGRGCAGTQNQVPVLTSLGAPKIGNAAFMITLANAKANATDALVLGLTKLKVPLDLRGGCSWFTSSHVILFGKTTAQGGDARTLPLLVSNSAAGFTMHCQWAVVDSGAGSFTGWAMSNGGSIVLYK